MAAICYCNIILPLTSFWLNTPICMWALLYMYCYIAVQYINIVSFFSYKLQISSVLARTRGTIYMYTVVWYDRTCTYQYNILLCLVIIVELVLFNVKCSRP